MTAPPRRPTRRVLHARYGIKTGEPGAQIVETGSHRATYDLVASCRSLFLMKAFPTPLVSVYVDEGKGWQLLEKLDFAAEVRR